MNLAFKDIRFNLGRFLLTAAGTGLLMTASIGMVGLYRGIVSDALLIIDAIGADLWVVQGGRAGPFAEGSAVSSAMDRRVEGVPGVVAVRRFVQFNQQFEFHGRTLRATLIGLDYPKDAGGWLHVVQGRVLATSHFEAVADTSIGLAIGDRVRLGPDEYTIVGLTMGMVDSLGDGLLFVSVEDAMDIGRRRTSEEVLLARAAAGRQGMPVENASSVPQDSKIAAILVSLDPAVNPARTIAAIARWGDVNILSRADQEDLLLNQRLWRLRTQILAFTAVMLMVTTIVISLIIYTMTVEKLHQIAMLKLIGARNAVIVGMIVQQAALIGSGGFIFGIAASFLIFPYFPRRVVIAPDDLGILFLVVVAISGFASLFGISRAMKVRAQEVLS